MARHASVLRVHAALSVPARGLGAHRRVPGNASGYTLENVRTLFHHPYIDAYWESIKLSLITAVIGGVAGLFIAYAAMREGTPKWIRSVLTTFSGVAANFGGIPLAFAFIASLGPLGVLTLFLQEPAALRHHRARLQPLHA